MITSNNSVGKNRDIEVLRCLAVLLTLFQHFHIAMIYPEGWINFIGKEFGFWAGVDLFFVVSGFVITRSLIPLYANDSRSISKKRILYGFWLKRVFRLLPTAWLWLFIPVATSILLAHLNIMPQPFDMFKGAIAGVLQLSNLYYSDCIAKGVLLTSCTAFHYSGHYWSLALEEQFYIIFPLLVLCLPVRKFSLLIVAAILVGVFWDRPPFSYAWHFRLDGFLWGILLAFFINEYPEWHQRIRPLFFENRFIRFVGVVLLLFLLAKFPATLAGLGLDFSGPSLTYSTACISLVAAVLVWLASYNRGYTLGHSHGSGAMVAIGARSYSLYVIHVPVFSLIHDLIPRVLTGEYSHGIINIFGLTSALFISFSLTELNYRYIEIPLRERGKSLTRRFYTAPNNNNAQ